MRYLLSLLTLLALVGMVSGDGSFYTSLSGDGQLIQTITANIEGISVSDTCTLGGQGLVIRSGVEASSSGFSYYKELKARSSSIYDRTVVWTGEGTWFNDVTRMTGKKLNFNKNFGVGSGSAFYTTNAWTGNRNSYGYNRLEKTTYIKNHFDGDWGIRKINMKTRASGSYEPDKYKLKTDVVVDFDNEKLHFWDSGFTQGDYAYFKNHVHTYIDGTHSDLTQTGTANPGKINYNLYFNVDL